MAFPLLVLALLKQDAKDRINLVAQQSAGTTYLA
jgi:hypothetical protein